MSLHYGLGAGLADLSVIASFGSNSENLPIKNFLNFFHKTY